MSWKLDAALKNENRETGCGHETAAGAHQWFFFIRKSSATICSCYRIVRRSFGKRKTAKTRLRGRQFFERRSQSDPQNLPLRPHISPENPFCTFWFNLPRAASPGGPGIRLSMSTRVDLGMHVLVLYRGGAPRSCAFWAQPHAGTPVRTRVLRLALEGRPGGLAVGRWCGGRRRSLLVVSSRRTPNQRLAV